MKTKIQIGVLVSTKIGTNTSILTDEYKFFNEFQRRNPDVEFILIAISEYTRKSILANTDLLEFDNKMLFVNESSKFHKLDGLSGIFTYMSRNSLFGGKIDRPCSVNYAICAYTTRHLKIPLFVRTPDSEYPYIDYKKLVDNRLAMDIPSTPGFIELNTREKKLGIMTEYIDYDYIYFIANGSRKICDWVPDIAHYDLPDNMKMMEPDDISKRTLYVSDAILFNVWDHYSKYEYLPKAATNNKFIFIGYLQGSVAAKRVKILPKMLSENVEEIPMDIIGPGAEDLNINRSDVNLISKGVYGKEFFELMNSYLAYIFIGKGNSINKYINKTVYDCLSARCPIVVYAKCDVNRIIFDDDEFYFKDETELRMIYDKLKNPEIRENWIDRQYKELSHKLDTLMDDMFLFSEFCEPKPPIKIDLRIPKLF